MRKGHTILSVSVSDFRWTGRGDTSVARGSFLLRLLVSVFSQDTVQGGRERGRLGYPAAVKTECGSCPPSCPEVLIPAAGLSGYVISPAPHVPPSPLQCDIH